METAGEGGAWGIALLAAYMINNNQESLADYLDHHVFAGIKGVEITPTAEEVAGFDKYIETYKAGLAIEQTIATNICFINLFYFKCSKSKELNSLPLPQHQPPQP